MTTKDAIKHLSWKISFAKQCSTHWGDCVDIDALEIAVRAMAEERKKGQWRYYDGMCSCSVCNSHMDDISPFCPMCGADMR